MGASDFVRGLNLITTCEIAMVYFVGLGLGNFLRSGGSQNIDRDAV